MTATTAIDTSLRERALRLHGDAIVIDAATQLCYGYSDHVRDSGVTAMNSTLPMPDDGAGAAVERIGFCYDVIRHDPKLVLIERPGDIARAKAEGKVGVIIALQDPLPLQSSLGMVEVFHRLGVRMLQLSYSGRSWAADGCGEESDAGLSKDGRQLVLEMNRVGVTVDIAHVGLRSSFEAVEVSGKPIVCSHGNARAKSDIGRNLPDDLIKAVAAKGGVVCATPYGPLNWNPGTGRPSLSDFLDMLDYMIDLAGIDHIGIGTDEESTPNTMPQMFVGRLRRKEYFKGAYKGYWEHFKLQKAQGSLQGFRGLNDYPLITEGLLARGYADSDIRKVLGLNLIRVFERTW